MKPLHEFATKQDAKLSLVWLDENFQQPLDEIAALNARVSSLGSKLADLEQKNAYLQSEVDRLGNTKAIVDRVIAELKAKPKGKK